MGRLQRKKQQQRREGAVWASRFFTPSNPENQGPGQTAQAPTLRGCPELTSPQPVFGKFLFLFWEICLSSTPTSYRVRGCIEKEISQKRKTDSQRLAPSQSCLEEKGNSQPLEPD